MSILRTTRVPRVSVLAALGALLVAGAAAHAVPVLYRVHLATADDLTQQCVSYTAGYLLWTEALETYQADGTVTHSPYLGRCLEIATGEVTDVDPSPDGLMWLSAGGGWTVYQRTEETTTIRAYNPADRSRAEIDAPEGVYSLPMTDGTLVVWVTPSEELWVGSLDSGERELMDTRALGYPAIDAGRVSWVSHVPWPHPDGSASDAGAASLEPVLRVNVWDVGSGETTSVAIPGFTPMLTDISGPLVIVTGETPDYRSHLYVWDTRTGEVRRALSAYPGYVSRSFISGERVAMSWTRGSGGGYQVRVLDLRTDAIGDVTAPEMYGLPWSFEGSTIGMTVKWPHTTLEAAWCNIDERLPMPVDDETPEPGGDPTAPSGGTSRTGGRTPYVEPAAGEPTAAVEATVTEPAETTEDAPESVGPAAGSSGPGPADDADPSADSVLPWVLAAAAGLVLAGGAGTLVRRNRRSASA